MRHQCQPRPEAQAGTASAKQRRRWESARCCDRARLRGRKDAPNGRVTKIAKSPPQPASPATRKQGHQPQMVRDSDSREAARIDHRRPPVRGERRKRAARTFRDADQVRETDPATKTQQMPAVMRVPRPRADGRPASRADHLPLSLPHRAASGPTDRATVRRADASGGRDVPLRGRPSTHRRGGGEASAGGLPIHSTISATKIRFAGG